MALLIIGCQQQIGHAVGVLFGQVMLDTHASLVLQVLDGFGLVAVITTKALQLLRLCHE